MKSKFTKIASVVIAIVLIGSSLAGCQGNGNNSNDVAKKSSTTTEPTTVSTTIQRTTENADTTFAESSTNKIYAGLSKNASDSYPYQIAQYTTYYDSKNETRTANLNAAVSKINNIVIPENYVFSFNQTVGKRTITAGYKTATVISEGEFVDGLGGGVCQVSSTIFECVLRANVEIVKRTYHSLEIGYVPLGGDATVQWNSKDFQFKNTTGSDVRLYMTCSNGKLICRLYAKKNVKVGNVKINISKSGNTYTLVRTVNGKQNYSTQSVYKKAPSHN